MRCRPAGRNLLTFTWSGNRLATIGLHFAISRGDGERFRESKCSCVHVTTIRQDADYILGLSHIEAGLFLRDNQIAVSDTFGNVLSTKEGNSIKNGVKAACSLILADCSNPTKVALVSGGRHARRVEGETPSIHPARCPRLLNPTGSATASP